MHQQLLSVKKIEKHFVIVAFKPCPSGVFGCWLRMKLTISFANNLSRILVYNHHYVQFNPPPLPPIFLRMPLIFTNTHLRTWSAREREKRCESKMPFLRTCTTVSALTQTVPCKFQCTNQQTNPGIIPSKKKYLGKTGIPRSFL